MFRWFDEIWRKYTSIKYDDKNTLLILDSASSHKNEEIKKKFRENGTRIAMIPGGLTSKL